ncbi:MAG: hypothetical protein JWR21_2132 [Herminiimonas sp.]|nr:hypothetical protein [Herminiimonas sp.]MDB5855290.1 hypothetical protein [Herminiimonas sp.]
MRCALLAISIVVSLTGCATPTGPNRVEVKGVGGKLQPGAYQLTSFDSVGVKVAGPVRIDIPFNDQSFAVGAMCSNDKAARVMAKGSNGMDAASFECARKQVNR